MIIEHYDGAVVLLTGALGFLSSVVLEQLLRLTNVSRVYLVVRSKKHLSAQQRVQDLLCSPLFHLLHKQALTGHDVFGKVAVMEGDLALPGLGLAAGDREALASVTDVLHCAALVELDAHVHKTLSNNYLGTKHLLQLAADMPQLRSFVFTSTFYVNNFLPHNSVVEECIYPLPLELDGEAVTPERFAEAMLSISPEDAQQKTTAVMRRLNFDSTYAFGKWLTESAFTADGVLPAGVRRAIVRPSLISGIAGDPWPGYVKGYAGPGGYCIAYGLRFFQGVGGVAYRGDARLDLIPADIVAALVIAAAVGGGADDAGSPAIFHATSSASHPMPIAWGFDRLAAFWRNNPAPISLPFTRFVRLRGLTPHEPTMEGITRSVRLAKLKLGLLELPLRLAGQQGKQALKLIRVGFKSFSVQNSLPYAKSLVCSVERARRLQLSLDPADVQAWQLVWEPTVMSWDEYVPTFLAGVRQLLLKVGGAIKGPPHSFVMLPAADPDSLNFRLPAEAAPCPEQSSSTSSARSEASMEEAGALADVILGPAAAPSADQDKRQVLLMASPSLKARGSAFLDAIEADTAAAQL